jgi:AraC-like DNA-binding protein/Tfp pilus assembly protein PilF
MRFLIVFLLILVAGPVYSQNRLLDSLYSLLKNHPTRDTVRVAILFDICYQEFNFRPEKNKAAAEEALSISNEINYSKGTGTAHGGIALYYWAIADYEQATRYAYKMLKIDEGISYAQGIGQSYQLLGLISHLEGEYEKTKAFYDKAIKIYKTGRFSKDLGSCYNLMGTFYLSFSQLDSASTYFFRSLRIREELNDEDGASQIYANLGRLFTLKNNYAQAREYFEKALRIMQKLNNLFRMSVILTGLGEMYLRTGDYSNAEFFLLRSVALAKSIRLNKKLEETYGRLTLLEKKRGRSEHALHYLELQSAYRDSLYTENKATKIAEMEARYETEKKDQMIQLLKRDKEIQMLWRNIFIAVFVLLSIAFLVMYYLQQYRERKNRQILNLEIEQLTSQHNELSQKYKSVLLGGDEKSIDSHDQRLLKKAIDVIENNMHDPSFGVEKMAQELGMSRTNMHRKIKAVTGFPPSELIRSIRLRKAAVLLLSQANSVSQISFTVGFEDHSYFSKAFKKQFGVPPSEYFQLRNQGAGA